MADAFELLADLRKYAEDTGVAETLLPVLDTLGTEVRGYADMLDGASTQLSEKETVISQSQAEISRLKSQNYDLVIAQQGKPEQQNTEPERPSGIAGLFTSHRKH